MFGAILAYGVIFSYFTILKHNVFQSYAWDLGVFNQALYTTVHDGKFFYYTADLYLNPTGIYFAQKISPILFLVLPFYSITSSPIALLVLKSFILAFGALPLYLLAKEILKSYQAGFLVALAYLLYAPLQGANWFDFQPQVFLPVLVFSLFYFATKSRWKLCFLSAVLSVMIIEQISVLIFLIGGYLLASSKVRPFWKSLKSFPHMNQNLASIIIMMFSLIYFAIAVWIKNSFPINPQFMNYYKANEAFTVLGIQGDPLLYPIHALLNPQRGLDALLYDFPLKLLYLVLLFAPLLFLSFRSKLVLATFPFLGLFLFSNFRGYYTVGCHYPLYLLPIIFVAALFVLKRFQHATRVKLLKVMLVVSIVFTISVSPLSPLIGPLVKEGALWYPSAGLSASENTMGLNNLVNILPANASVLTQNHIFPHVSSRINAYVLPLTNLADDQEYLKFLINSSDFVLLDLTFRDLNTNLVLNEITQDNSYGLYALASNSVLFKRDFEGEPLYAQYAQFKVYSAYNNLFLAPFSQTIDDPTASSEKIVLCPTGSSGYFIYGPYTHMTQGAYKVTFEVKVEEHSDSLIGKLEIANDMAKSILVTKKVFSSELQPNKWTNFTLELTLTKFATSIEFRAYSNGITNIAIDKVIVEKVE